MKTPRNRNNDTMHVRLPAREKRAVEALASHLGVSTAGVVRLAIKQITHQNTIALAVVHG